LQFLASAVHALWNRKGASAPLIGPGDVDLADAATRSSFFTQVGERDQYTSVVSSDIVSDNAGAKQVDRQLGADNAAIAQLAVGSRAATAVMLYSFGARQGEDRGVLQMDLISALLAPGLDRNVIVTALNDLREEALYLHFTGRRYRFEPTPNLAKLVRDEASKYDGPEILDKLRGELEATLRGTRGVSVWPAGPDAIDDGRPLFTVAYLHPDWSERAQPQTRFVEDAAGGPRRYRNGLALALPDTAQFDQARHNMRQHLAAAMLIAMQGRYGFSTEQLEELNDKAATTLRNARAAIARSYGTVSIPVRDRSAGTPFTMTPLDLRTMVTAGRPLHERVVSALESHVFSKLTAAKLVSLAGLGPERNIVSCADLVDWFYSYFEFTKLWDRKAIAGAICDAVAGSEAGYAIGLVRHGDATSLRAGSLVRLGEHLPTDEIDLSDDSALIWFDYAHELRAGKDDTGDTGPTDQGDRTPDGEEQPEPGGDTGETPKPPPADVIRVANLSARVDRDGIFDLQRALSWLREKAATVSVEIRIHVEGDLPRTEFRNGVMEPIEEKGHDVTVSTS
jgi:hypothetical protein